MTQSIPKVYRIKHLQFGYLVSADKDILLFESDIKNSKKLYTKLDTKQLVNSLTGKKYQGTSIERRDCKIISTKLKKAN